MGVQAGELIALSLEPYSLDVSVVAAAIGVALVQPRPRYVNGQTCEVLDTEIARGKLSFNDLIRDVATSGDPNLCSSGRDRGRA